MRNIGRPTDLTPEVQETICEAIQAGNYLEPSAALAGVSKSTVYKWIKRGAAEKKRLSKSKRARMKKREAPFVAFVDAIREADAIAEVRDVATIAAAAEKNWAAAAWRLARKHHARWGGKTTVEGDVPVRATIVQYPVTKRDEPDEGEP